MIIFFESQEYISQLAFMLLACDLEMQCMKCENFSTFYAGTKHLCIFIFYWWSPQNSTMDFYINSLRRQ